MATASEDLLTAAHERRLLVARGQPTFDHADILLWDDADLAGWLDAAVHIGVRMVYADEQSFADRVDQLRLAFDSFVRTINLTDAQKLGVTNKRNKTEEYLRAEFTNMDDIFETYRYKSGDFLQRIRTALQASTSISQIGARGQAVRLFYTSGAHVDIAPVFKWSSGGFGLLSGDNGWMTTDPEKQATWMGERLTSDGGWVEPDAGREVGQAMEPCSFFPVWFVSPRSRHGIHVQFARLELARRSQGLLRTRVQEHRCQ